jgi:hypothetical protein
MVMVPSLVEDKVAGDGGRLTPVRHRMAHATQPPMATSGQYGLQDLVSAWLDLRRYGNADPSLATFHVQRYSALAAAFGVWLEKPPVRFHDPLYDLLQRTAGIYGEARSPFDVYLEAPLAIITLHRLHGQDLDAAVEALHTSTTDLLVSLVATLWEKPADMTVGPDELLRHGFDPAAAEPDPLDFV